MLDFIQHQRRFTAHIRDAKQPAPPDVAARRMQLYRDLFFNNVESLLAGTYPVLNDLLPKAQWHALVADYFAQHQAHTPLFPQMPKEFLRYLEQEREPQPDDPAFLWELAHYEWVELGLSIDNREVEGDGSMPDDVLSHHPRLSALAWVFAYRFPVHQINPDFQPDEPPAQPTYLVIYRNLEDDVGFLELNPVTARLLALIEEHQGNMSGQALLEVIAKELQHPQPEQVLNGGISILQDLYGRSVLF